MATGGSTGGGATQRSGAATTQTYTFDDMAIQGKLKTFKITNRENMRNVIARSLKQTYDEAKKNVNDFYLLHSWSSPIPISLGTFITNVSRKETLTQQEVTITMKMPFSAMRTIFSDEIDTITTGQFLTIRHFSESDSIFKSDVVAKVERNPDGTFKTETTKVQQKNTSFFGFITRISQQFNNTLGVDNYATVTIVARDFLEPIRNCNYVVMPGNLKEDEDGNTTSLPNQVEMEFLTSFIMRSDEWKEHIKDMAEFAAEAKDFQLVMENFLANFGYMLIPPSVALSMRDFISFSKNFIDAVSPHVSKQVGTAAGNTAAGGPSLPLQTSGDMQFTAFLMGIGAQIDYFQTMDLLSSTSGRELGFLSRKELIERAKARRAAAQRRGARQQTQSQVAGSSTAPISRDKRSLGLNNLEIGLSDRIGECIVVATKKSDVPKSSIWYQMLPENPPYQRFIQKFQGALQTRSSAWQRIVGTFQSDNRMIEMIPTMIPFYDEDFINFVEDVDSRVAQSAEGNVGSELRVNATQSTWQPRGRISKALGAQPTIIYRIKPRHWNTQLNKEFLNKVYKQFEEQYITDGMQPITYPLSGEAQPLTGIKTDELLQQSLLPILSDQVFDFQATWNEADRVNGTYIESALIQNRTGYETGVLATPNIDIYDAYKYGLRLFEGTYPFFNVYTSNGEPLPKTATEQDAGMRALTRNLNKAFNDAFSEEMFLTYGNGNRYASGTITLNYQASANWSPGKWGYMHIRDFGSGSNELLDKITGDSSYQNFAERGVSAQGRPPGGSDDYGDPEQRAYFFSNFNVLGGVENNFFFYIDGISHSTMITPKGVKTSRTTISFSRGAWHYLPPVLPEIKYIQKALERGK